MTRARPVARSAERSVVTVRAHASRLVVPGAWLLVVSGVGGLALGWASGRPSWVGWVVAVLSAVALVRLSLVPFLRWWTTTTEVTTRRLSLRWGVLARHGRDLPLRRVVDVALDRSLAQRSVGSGTLTLVTAGDDEPLVLDAVPQPDRLYSTLVALVSAEAGDGDAGDGELDDGELDDEMDLDDDGEDGW